MRCAGNRVGLQPIFTHDQLGEPADCISDGIVHSPHEAVLKARALLERLEQLDASLFAPEVSDFFRILGYMFSRAGMSIALRRLWSNQSFCTYPVLEAMLGSYELVVSRLAALGDRKLILHNKLSVYL